MANYKGKLTGKQLDELPENISELRKQTKDISDNLGAMLEMIQSLIQRANAMGKELEIITGIIPTKDKDNNGIPDGEDRLSNIETENTWEET